MFADQRARLNRRKSSTNLRSFMKIKHLTFVGIILSLSLTSGVAFAQSSNTSPERELSPEELLSFCERFPMNSRCINVTPAPRTGTPIPSTTPPDIISPSPDTPASNTDIPTLTPSDSISPSPQKPSTSSPSPDMEGSGSPTTPDNLQKWFGTAYVAAILNLTLPSFVRTYRKLEYRLGKLPGLTSGWNTSESSLSN